MSDPKNTSPERDAVAEQNITKLLQQAKDEPRLAPEPRARILKALLAHQQAQKAAQPEPQPPVVQVEKLSTEKPKPAPKPSRRAWALGLVGLAAAASLSVLLFGGRAPEFAGRVYQNEQAETLRVTLSDGSSLLLQHGARAEEKAPRVLSLSQGNVLLDVVPGGPFVVQTPQGAVEVLGTRFVLESEPGEVRAAVMRGVVKLQGNGQDLLLRAGEAGALSENAPPARRPAERVSFLARWAQEKLRPEATAAPARSGLLLARNPTNQSDEWPLPMREFSVDVFVEDQIARVAIDQTFLNHTPLTLEGVYSFPLPAGAALSRLAMYVDGTRMEAGIVERQEARNIYESIVYQRRDPALLEWMQGNTVRVRVFPLPARTEKRLFLTYTQALSRLYDSTQLVIPIPELEQATNTVSYRVRVAHGAQYEFSSSSHEIRVSTEGDDALVSFSAQNEKLGKDFVLEMRTPKTEPVRVVRIEEKGARYLSALVQPALPGETRHEPRRWVLLYDTSASRSPALLAVQQRLAAYLLNEIDEDDEIHLSAFDASVRAFAPGFTRVRDLDLARVGAFLTEQGRDSVGYTDLKKAFSYAVETLSPPSDKAPYILYLGDGIDTAGNDPASFAGLLTGKAALVAVPLGDSFDAVQLRTLAEKSGGFFAPIGQGDDLAWRAFDLVAALQTPRVLGLKARLLDASGKPLPEGSALLSSQQVSAGEEVRVVARYDGEAPTMLELSGTLRQEPWSERYTLANGRAGARYLPRLWAQLRVEALQSAGFAQNQTEITALGLEHFLLTPFTSLLVLENDAMYKQFKVNRGSEDDWARYPAPEKIPVRTEAAPQYNNLAVPVGAPLFRVPFSPFSNEPYNSLWGGGSRFLVEDGEFAPSSFAQPANSQSLLSAGLGLKGFGVGGGGRGEGSIGLGSVMAMDRVSSFLPVGAAEVASRSVVVGGTGSPVQFAGFAGKKDGPKFAGFFRNDDARERRGTRNRNYYGTRAPVPQRFSYAYDAQLDDLSEFVPGLLGDSFDFDQEQLTAALAHGSGEMQPEALSLLQKARATLSPAKFRSPDGMTLSVDEQGHFSLRHRLPTGLTEQVFFDGAELVQSYEELGLATRRNVGAAAFALYQRWLPFWIPSPEILGASFLVKLSAPGVVTLTLPGEKEPAYTLQFDTEGRLASVRGAQARLQISYSADAVTLEQDGTRILLTREPASSVEKADLSALVVVQMPLVSPSGTEVETALPGSAEWRAARWQRLAAYAALGQSSERWRVFQELLTQFGTVQRGELALASGSIQQIANAKELKNLVAAVGKSDPVARYVESVWRLNYNSSTSKLDALSRDAADSLVGMLASYRALLLIQQQSSRDASHSLRLKDFAARYPHAPFLYVVVYQYSNRLPYFYVGAYGSNYPAQQNIKTAREAWGLLAGFPAWRYTACYEEARFVYSRGDYETAASLFESCFAEALAANEAPDIDYALQQALQYSSEGESRWTRFLAVWRAHVLESKSVEELLALLSSLSQLYTPSTELDRLIPALASFSLERPADAAEVASLLAEKGRYDVARDLLQPWISRADAPTELLVLASQLSELSGDNVGAAKFLDASLHAQEGKPVVLESLRQNFRQLFTLYARDAQGLRPNAEAKRQALGVAARWREIDPDNHEIDALCSSLLYATGEPEEAWRYLSTTLERHPSEGASFSQVASVLEREGRWSEAEQLWSRASIVEPTDPTWHYKRAQALLGLGRRAEALSELEGLRGKTWQERFTQTLRQAESLRKRLAAP